MNQELIEEIKIIIKENVAFKFKNFEIKNNILMLDVNASFQEVKLEFVYIGCEFADNYLVKLTDCGSVIFSSFVEIEEYFSSIILQIGGSDKVIDKLSDKPSIKFISDAVAELLEEIFKQSRTYKMYCLYDKRIEKFIE